MYNYIKGEIVTVTSTHIVVECQNIGYQIKVPNPFLYAIGEQHTIHVYFHVREDIMELYGFPTSQERDMFVRLINVKGLGPKGGLAIMASTTPEEIAKAVEAANARFFATFPGIGAKSSQQIILDLKGKLVFDDVPVTASSEKLLNVQTALKALGYSNPEIKAATKDLPLDDSVSLSDAVKNALRRLQKN